MTDTVNNLTSIVNSAVVCAELNNGKTERTLCVSFFRSDFTN